VAAVQQPPAWLAPPRGERPCQQLRLVVPTAANVTARRWRPGDDVDLGRVEAATELLGEVMCKPSPVAVLETDDEVLGEPGELGGGDDSTRGDDRR
jgi:hypothetical protein